MEHDFWHDKWEANNIAFHEGNANPLLVEHFEQLTLAAGDRIFVPLCGKTVDIAWLLSHGCVVSGIELSELAVKQLFGDLGIEPSVTNEGSLKRYSAPGIDIFAGDIFELTKETLGHVNAVYDRAALVALPEPMRFQYSQHLSDICDGATQLLITFDYDQNHMNGPPFSISTEEVQQHYANRYTITSLDRANVAGGLKGQCVATECIWLLTN